MNCTVSLTSFFVVGFVAFTVSNTSQAASFSPSANVTCIAPADPGGGWDFTCRSVGKLLVEQQSAIDNVQTINLAGGGGGAAFAHTVTKEKTDDNLIVAASTATATRLGQNMYPGMNMNQVRWVAAIGADYGVIAVAKSSPYHNLKELVAAMKKDPKAVKFAGGSAGWDRLKVLMLAKQGHVKGLSKIPYLPYEAGTEALLQVVGGHISAFTGDLSEAKGFKDAGDIRILAVLSAKRLPAPLNTIPTAAEQGFDVVAPNWRGFYVPAQASEASYKWWVSTIDKLSHTPTWKATMVKNGLVPFEKTGPVFTQFVKQQINEIRSLSQEVGLIK